MVVAENDKYYWDYSESSDILNIHQKDKKIAGSAELGDFTVDFDNNGKVVGIEVMYASEFFGNLNISKQQLSNLKSAELIIPRKNPSVTIIYIKMLLPQNIEQITPIPTPILARIK